MFPAAAALLVALGGASQAPRSTSSAVVVGRVIDAATRQPVAGAILTLHGSAAAPARRSRSAVPPSAPRVMTDIGGRFVLRGLSGGTLFLSVAKGGYIDAMQGQRRPGGSAQPIQVVDGQRITDVEIRKWRHAVITGVVVDELGEPIVGARVQSYSRTFIAGRPRYLVGVFGSTDDRGVYRLAGLMPGDYRIAATSPLVSVPTGIVEGLLQGTTNEPNRSAISRDLGSIGAAVAPAGTQFAMAAGTHTISLNGGTATPRALDDGSFLTYPTVFYPASLTASDAAIVSVKSGEERSGVDLQMQPLRSVKVAGTVIGPGGAAANVPLRLVPAASDEILGDTDAASTMSDATGAFTFPAVPPGQYVLRVIRVPRLPVGADDGNRVTIVRTGSAAITTSASPNPGPVLPPPIPSDSTLVGEIPVAVGDVDVSGLTVVLRVGPRVSGRVEFDGSGDKPDPTAIANMRITLDPADAFRLPDDLGFATGRVDDSGRFTTYGVPPGKYFVRVSGLSDWFFKGAFLQGRDLADVPIELRDDDVSGVVLTFTDRPSSIVGMVRGNQGLDGAAVVLAFPVDSDDWRETGTAPRRLRTARAGSDGSYVFPALPPGEYYLAALREDVLFDPRDPELLESISRSAARVHVLEGERKTQDLRTTSIRN